MKIRTLHRWPRSTRAAIALQERLAGTVRLCKLPRGIRFVAGADVAFARDGQSVLAGVVVYDLQMGTRIEQAVSRTPARFPYVPGLLSFRELPGVLAAFRKVQHPVDAVLCDAQGLAHPRRIGLACHLGLWLELSTVGCAKSRLCGDHDGPAVEKGSQCVLSHADERVGTVLRTRTNVKPLYVSPGHMCDFAGAVRLTLVATTRFRLPEPTRLAHQLVTRARQGLLEIDDVRNA